MLLLTTEGKDSMRITVDDDIYLELFDIKFVKTFFGSIHASDAISDSYRESMQRKYPKIEDLEFRIQDAIQNKYLKDGTPDFFIFYRGNLAGVFEFHPLTADDHIEIGYWLYSEFRKLKIMSRVFTSMIPYAKNHFNRPKLLACTAPDNQPSLKLLESVGFIETGKSNGELEFVLGL